MSQQEKLPPPINALCFHCRNPVGRDYVITLTPGDLRKPVHRKCDMENFRVRHGVIKAQGNRKVFVGPIFGW